MHRITPLYFIITFLFLPLIMKAQAFEKIIEFLTIHPNAKAVKMDSTLYPAKAIFTPVISYAPETNLSFGVGMKGLFKMNGSGSRNQNFKHASHFTIHC